LVTRDLELECVQLGASKQILEYVTNTLDNLDVSDYDLDKIISIIVNDNNKIIAGYYIKKIGDDKINLSLLLLGLSSDFRSYRHLKSYYEYFPRDYKAYDNEALLIMFASVHYYNESLTLHKFINDDLFKYKYFNFSEYFSSEKMENSNAIEIYKKLVDCVNESEKYDLEFYDKCIEMVSILKDVIFNDDNLNYLNNYV